MSGKIKDVPPTGEPYVWQTRELRCSDAWRSASINCRRFLDFLILEHMRHGGQRNGKLKAPRRQLEDFGISARHITSAIEEAEELGLVDCHRGGMRVATDYGLTWCKSHDGASASNRWRTHVNPNLKPLTIPKRRNLTSEGKSGLTSEGKSDGPNLTTQGKSDRPKSLVSEGKHPSRKASYQDAAIDSVGEARAGAAAAADAGADVVPLSRVRR